VHQALLNQLAAMLPTGCVPILITDAGFRGAWFRTAWAGTGSVASATVTWSARRMGMEQHNIHPAAGLATHPGKFSEERQS